MTEKEVSYGIAAQLALRDFLKARLEAGATGWDVDMTEPGSPEDRLKGIDFYFVSPDGEAYPVDVSLQDKPGKLVLRMYDDWFTRESRRSFETTHRLVVDPRKADEVMRAVAQIVYRVMDARGKLR